MWVKCGIRRAPVECDVCGIRVCRECAPYTIYPLHVPAAGNARNLGWTPVRVCVGEVRSRADKDLAQAKARLAGFKKQQSQGKGGDGGGGGGGGDGAGARETERGRGDGHELRVMTGFENQQSENKSSEGQSEGEGEKRAEKKISSADTRRLRQLEEDVAKKKQASESAHAEYSHHTELDRMVVVPPEGSKVGDSFSIEVPSLSCSGSSSGSSGSSRRMVVTVPEGFDTETNDAGGTVELRVDVPSEGGGLSVLGDVGMTGCSDPHYAKKSMYFDWHMKEFASLSMYKKKLYNQAEVNKKTADEQELGELVVDRDSLQKQTTRLRAALSKSAEKAQDIQRSKHRDVADLEAQLREMKEQLVEATALKEAAQEAMAAVAEAKTAGGKKHEEAMGEVDARERRSSEAGVGIQLAVQLAAQGGHTKAKAAASRAPLLCEEDNNSCAKRENNGFILQSQWVEGLNEEGGDDDGDGDGGKGGEDKDADDRNGGRSGRVALAVGADAAQEGGGQGTARVATGEGQEQKGAETAEAKNDLDAPNDDAPRRRPARLELTGLCQTHVGELVHVKDGRDYYGIVAAVTTASISLDPVFEFKMVRNKYMPQKKEKTFSSSKATLARGDEEKWMPGVREALGVLKKKAGVDDDDSSELSGDSPEDIRLHLRLHSPHLLSTVPSALSEASVSSEPPSVATSTLVDRNESTVEACLDDSQVHVAVEENVSEEAECVGGVGERAGEGDGLGATALELLGDGSVMSEWSEDGEGMPGVEHEESVTTTFRAFAAAGEEERKTMIETRPVLGHFVSVTSTEEEVEQALEEVVATMHPDEP